MLCLEELVQTSVSMCAEIQWSGGDRGVDFDSNWISLMWGTEENPSSTFQSSTHSFTAASTPVLLLLSHIMSHGILSREELYKFYGYEMAPDINTESAVVEFLDLPVDDIDDAFPELTAPASSKETYVAAFPPFTNATSRTIDVPHMTYTEPITGAPERPPTPIPSRSTSVYPLLFSPTFMVCIPRADQSTNWTINPHPSLTESP